ncbi:MAG: YbaB/EbfC family nucleoid-associated protein [Micromonosporaceae bacterium]|nr:YbaB/EbfC family nucleoid-associated protein [Micromonosporaceae bacterium]
MAAAGYEYDFDPDTEASQQRLEMIQRSVDRMEVIGYSRNRELTVVMRGSGELVRVRFDDADLLRRPDPEQLSALMVEAVNDGLRRADAEREKRFAPLLAEAEALYAESMRQIAAGS